MRTAVSGDKKVPIFAKNTNIQRKEKIHLEKLDRQKLKEGKSSIPSQFEGNGQGMDRVYKSKVSPKKVEIVEAKFVSGFKPGEVAKALGKLNETRKYGLQGTEEYIYNQTIQLTTASASNKP